MSPMASQITFVYSTVYLGTDQRKHLSSASLAFVRGIHRWPVNTPHKRPVTWKMFPFDDVIMRDKSWSAVVQVIAWSLMDGSKPLPEPDLTYLHEARYYLP